MTLVFLHGAGGYVEDRPLAEGLAAGSATDLRYPELSDQDMSVAAWSAQIAEALGDLGADDRVVAHSFGASVLLLMLADGLELPGEVRMLAMPNWGPDGWDVAEYAFAGSEPSTPLVLQHCRDDEVVPFHHLALNAALLPAARVVVRDRGGHQFGF
ncbi:MAG TPA: hypothetical protein VM429_01660 [Micropruina sp.]|nr:hypothetical protein [Micropruina sp.]